MEIAPTRDWRGLAGGLFPAAIAVGAFLLFQVQPMLSKAILPRYGGAAAVWSTCVLFFQVLLCAGYLYADASRRWLPISGQAALHMALLAAACWLLPLAPTIGSGVDTSAAEAEAGQAASILAWLAATVGLPYFLLSSTGPLVSSWRHRAAPNGSTYRLYALSNAGSLAALVSYPFLFEPAFDIPTQARFWTWGFWGFAGLSAASGLAAWQWNGGGEDRPEANSDERDGHETAGDETAESGARVPRAPASWRNRIGWLAWPAFGTWAMLSTTTAVSQDVAVLPLLWVVPLSLYLVSLILCFEHDRWYDRRVFGLALLGFVAVGAPYLRVLVLLNVPYRFVHELVIYLGGMFCACMLAHGEVARLRPDPRQLTGYYLAISVGGALGGAFVALAAPALFDSYLEWPLGILVGCALAVWLAVGREVVHRLSRQRRIVVPAAIVALLVAASVANESWDDRQKVLWERRNFYGAISVVERNGQDAELHARYLTHGRITHGMQFQAEDKRRLPTSYFGRESGIGQTLQVLAARSAARGGVRVAVVGLGVGTLAAYGRPGDSYRFFELDPQVAEAAERFFTYLSDSPARMEVVLGDARANLSVEGDARYDLLVMDAFSGDSVPTHLLTTEAFSIYDRRLAANGVLAINVSNPRLDLRAIVLRLAEKHGYRAARVLQPETEQDRHSMGLFASDWMILSRDAGVLEGLRKHQQPLEIDLGRTPLWTDTHTDLLRILR